MRTGGPLGMPVRFVQLSGRHAARVSRSTLARPHSPVGLLKPSLHSCYIGSSPALSDVHPKTLVASIGATSPRDGTSRNPVMWHHTGNALPPDQHRSGSTDWSLKVEKRQHPERHGPIFLKQRLMDASPFRSGKNSRQTLRVSRQSRGVSYSWPRLDSDSLRNSTLVFMAGFQWISLDVTGSATLKKPRFDKDLQRHMDFIGTPWIVEVERVNGTSPINQPID